MKEDVKHLTPEEVEENMRLIEDLKFFLATAPANWQKNQIIRRYYLNHDEGFVSCVFWNNLYFITGTDIVRCIVYRFEQFGREIVDRKKFEEGIFSDLRSLKCGTDAVLEASKSPFLEFLYRNSCLRTQKKQKVFFWFSVPHDKLFVEALERDLKKEQINQVATTRSKSEPSLSFKYDSLTPLHDQLSEYVQNQRKQSSSDETSEATLMESTPEITTDSSFALDPTNATQQSFFIKEENGTPVVTPGKAEDDFPLDYFPQTHNTPLAAPVGPLLLDPSVFMNPPESYNDQFLIDQTYAKTPFYETQFDQNRRDKGKHALDDNDNKNTPHDNDNNNDDANDVDDDDEYLNQQFIPVSVYPPGSSHLAPPPSQPQAYPSTYPPHYYPAAHFAHLPPQQAQITNGQFYDSQLNGEPLPIGLYQQEYYSYNPYQQALPSYYHDQQMPGESSYLSTYPPPFFHEDDLNDGDDQLYEQFEKPFLSHQSMSPLARVFPSFQATAPPPRSPLAGAASNSFKNANKLRTGKNGRVVKSSSLKTQQSRSTLTKTALKEKLDNELKDTNESETPKDSSREQSVVKSEKEDNEDEVEYTTLPTPESTAPEHQQSGHDHPGNEILAEFVEES